MILSPKHILWPTDFSPLSMHAARYVRGLHELFKPQLHVVHVVPPPFTPDVAVTIPADVPVAFADEELLESCRRRLAEVVAEQFPGLSGIKTDTFFGNPWSAICKYAEQGEIDLIVVSTHGRTGLRRVLIGSTAERIVQHAPCPVLVVKNPEKDFASG